MKHVALDAETLKAALSGYNIRLQEMTRQIAALKHEISEYKQNHRLRYKMSSAARKRVSEAQKKRWRAFRKERKTA